MHTEFETRDAHSAWDYLRQAFGADVRVTGDPDLLRVARDDLGSIRLDDVEYRTALEYEAGPTGWFTVAEGWHGWADVSRHGVTDRIARGTVVVVSTPDEGYAGRTGPALHERLLSIDRAALDQAARDLGDGDGPVAFAHLTPVNAAAAAPWRNLSDFIARTIAANPIVLRQQLAVSALTQLAAHTALAVFANETWATPSESEQARDSVDGSSGAVLRAVAFIESSAHLDITVVDIAESAHVTPRALQYGFRRRLDTTPMAYLRKVRLHHARAELLAAEPGTTVAEVAGRWGFFNLGRFASYYRSEFGENPAQTLSGTGPGSSESASA